VDAQFGRHGAQALPDLALAAAAGGDPTPTGGDGRWPAVLHILRRADLDDLAQSAIMDPTSVFNMPSALGLDELANLTRFAFHNRSGLPANSSGILFDLGDSGPVWDNSVNPHKMETGAVEWAHNFTRDTLRPLIHTGALRIIMLGDDSGSAPASRRKTSARWLRLCTAR
jgi:hypothetical protein